MPLDPGGFALSTNGFMSAKVDPLDDDPIADQNQINHHGAFYLDILPSMRFADAADIQVRLNLQNASFSELRTAEAAWFVKASVERPFWRKSSEDSSKLWRLEAGNFDPVTLGQGLTFKDYQALGVAGRLDWNGTSLQIASWAQDYGERGDIFTARVHLARFHSGMDAVIWLEELVNGLHSVYLLPYFNVPVGDFGIYGEAGLRFTEEESRSLDNVRGYPDWTGAALAGLRYRSPWPGWRLRADSELRYYGKNFIPLAEIRDDQFTSLYNYDKSSNNWIDHFSSILDSRWVYLKAALETPSWNGISLFAENELLLYLGDQDLFWERYSQALISHNPSSDFYWAGIRYGHRGRLRLELLATNRLINIDPQVNRHFSDDIYYYAKPGEVRRQYRSRFYPAETPLLEIRMVWGMDAD